MKGRPLIGIFLLLALVLSGCTADHQTELEGALAQAEQELQVAKEKVVNLEEELQLTDQLKEEFIKDREILKKQIEDLGDGLTITLADSDNEQVMCLAIQAVEMIADQDFAGLAGLADPGTGIRFSPYPYVSNTDLVFTGTAIDNFFADSAVYAFGSYDGSGDPIELSKTAYYGEFIYDEDFKNAPHISLNWDLGTGNMIANHESFYPGSKTVEFHFTGFNPIYEGLDWRSLRLVFQPFGSDWKLVGIIHGQWTI
jgi:hypothetical protein